MEYNPQRDVAKMMRAYGQEVKATPEMPDEATRLLRARLILEETLETITRGLGVSITYAWGDEEHNIGSMKDVMLKVTGPGDLIELADGTADIKVVVYGTDNAAGLNAPAVFDEVMDSNMSKLNSDGTVTRDSYGKVIKPSHYRPADVPKVLGMKASS